MPPSARPGEGRRVPAKGGRASAGSVASRRRTAVPAPGLCLRNPSDPLPLPFPLPISSPGRGPGAGAGAGILRQSPSARGGRPRGGADRSNAPQRLSSLYMEEGAPRSVASLGSGMRSRGPRRGSRRPRPSSRGPRAPLADRSTFSRSGVRARVPHHGTADRRRVRGTEGGSPWRRCSVTRNPTRSLGEAHAVPRFRSRLRGSGVGSAVPESVPAFRSAGPRSGRGSRGPRPRSAGNDDVLAFRGAEPGQNDRRIGKRSAATGHPEGESARAAAVPRLRMPERGRR
jgi:hypothetical protein